MKTQKLIKYNAIWILENAIKAIEEGRKCTTEECAFTDEKGQGLDCDALQLIKETLVM